MAALGRAYPLVSGCGAVATRPPLTLLAPPRRADVWARVAGTPALVPLDDLVGRAMYFLGELDPKVTRTLVAHLRPGEVALDIGANLGLVSLHMARAVGPRGRVHAFEPNPRMQAYLAATLAASPALPVRLHPVALGPEEGALDLHVPPGNAGAASLVSAAPLPQGERVRVPVRPLDVLAEEEGIDRVAVIKMDVEGFEAQVLRGAGWLIARTRPRAIVIEENGLRPGGPEPEAFALLRALGYGIEALPRALFRPRRVALDRLGDQVAHDFLATPRSLP
jgi:FkbM family methyltransferase